MTAYDWTVSGGSITSGGDGNNTATVTWSASGAQTISVTYSSLGCPAASPKVYNVTVADKPSPNTVQISPTTLKKGLTVNTTYVYVPGVCFPEDLSKTEIRWYRDDDGTDPGSQMITMKYATNKTYTIVNDDRNKYLKVGIKLSDGTSLRDEVFSSWYGPVGDNPPIAENVSILGNIRSGLNVYGTYTYFDEEDDAEATSTFKWYTANNAAGTDTRTQITGATAGNYTIGHAYIGKYLGFEVTPVATNGSGTPVLTSPFVGPIANSAPTASTVSISGVKQAGQVLTGMYTYYDAEGDVESGSTYKWFSSGSLLGTYTEESGVTGRSRVLTLADQGKYFKFSVVPKAATGTQTVAEEQSPTGFGAVNSKPVATGVSISGTVTVGSTLTGNYALSDPDGDGPQSATFRWLRSGGLAISGATSSTYIITADDEGYTLTFEVTPYSTSGYPTTGDAVLSSATVEVPISPSSPKPVASDVCIQGIRAEGQVLTARYTYTFTRAEGTSERKWFRGASEIGTGLTYMLTADDISSTDDITFQVTPKSVSTVKTGTTVTSAPLARINLTQTTYPVTVESVSLTANNAGGVFSGSNVTNGIFSPKNAGVGGPFTVTYNYNIENTTNTCSQKATKDLTVIPASTDFGSVKTVYCRDEGQDLITVENIPADAIPYTPYGFFINSVGNKIGIVSGSENLLPNPYSGTAPWSVSIDPAALNVGTSYLYLYYNYLGYYYLLRATLVLEQVGTITEISNLSTDYCAADDPQNIQVYGLYPSGGTAEWTGSILTDKTSLIAKVHPELGTPGQTYHITYQYTTANGCKSNILPKDVTIHAMPDASFDLDPTYNVEGDPFTLIDPMPADGVFYGDGISGNKLFPNLAGTGPKAILFRIVDGNGCIDEQSKNTVIRKAQGTINGLSSVECYRDQTINVTVTGLPDGPLDDVIITDFKNKKNSIIWTSGATALYNIAAARAGYDTLTFSYTWDDVLYSITKGVYIDSIGKIVITGLKDNYCDYEGTATLRVLVENSTGSGNFSFSGPSAGFNNYGLLADFYPSLTPPSGTPYAVSYTHTSTVNNSGCTKTASLPVTVNQAPAVSIFNSRVTVNVKEDPLSLSGSPAEGIFSGKGVYKSGTDYVFNPNVAGLGDNEIALTFTDTKGCTTARKDTLYVRASSGTILGINPNNQYCYDGLTDTLTYSSSNQWFNGSFSGAGITDIGSARAVFNPATARKGDHNVTFTYYDVYNTKFEVSASVNVDSLGVVEIKPITAGDEYCENDTPFELITTPRGGIFTGPVTTGFFTPSKALGDTAITYTYLNVRTGCSITGRVPFTIHPAPVVAFAPVNLCINISSKDSTRFINSSTSADEVSSWLWSFSDIGGTEYSSRQEPGYPFKSGGQHLVTLTATTVNDCKVKKDITFDFGVKPTADFLWKNECFIAGDSVMLYDNTISPSEVRSRTWNFFDGRPLKAGTTVYYPKNTIGAVPVRYIVETNYANCSDTVFRNIYIRPNIVISADGYFEDFESGSGGWSKGEEDLNSWTFGTPDRNTIKSAASGTAAWFTKFDTTQVENSSVISPCFDFTNIQRPMISIGLRRSFDRDMDGAVLQYRLGDNEDWQPVGTLDDGIFWYNSAVIKGLPGGDRLGWTTGNESTWINAKHSLDDLKGRKDVKFRIAYGSNGNAKGNDGLAFDDIFLGERKRIVLLEHFANASYLKSSEATEMINEIDNLYDKDIANIQYHTNFPGIDSFYIANPGDASARVLFYGLTKTPYSFIDGGTGKDKADVFAYSQTISGVLAPIDKNVIIQRGLIEPFFDIVIDTLDISGGVLTVNGKITSLSADTISNLTLYVAVVEKTNSTQTGAAGETVFKNVFRKFLPDAAGINLPRIWSKGMSFSITDMSWIIQKSLKPSDIEVVAFIQNNITREVYQASSMFAKKIAVGIEKPGIIGNIGFSVYPNPARHQLSFSFDEALQDDTEIFIYDFSGTIVRTYRTGAGETEFTVDDLGLKDGMYLIKVSSGGMSKGFKKLIISGS
ncbi:MAG TPA: T9SS type A sorting domain-containing protein [Bacteroidales bacterium]|nr:T9SS type A sorting domain-containing protein [Bacteroidales bacterium]